MRGVKRAIKKVKGGLCGLFGLPVDESGKVHGRQAIALPHIVRKLVDLVREESSAPAPHVDELPAETVFDVASAEAFEPTLREPPFDQREAKTSTSARAEIFVNCRSFSEAAPPVESPDAYTGHMDAKEPKE